MGVWIEIASKVYGFPWHEVTPLVGVWIEIQTYRQTAGNPPVTPLVGVWIEIDSFMDNLFENGSLPLWECGLKSIKGSLESLESSHSPCGSVD